MDNLDPNGRLAACLALGMETLDWWQLRLSANGGSDGLMDAMNPSTGERLWQIPVAGRNAVDLAVTTARQAQTDWAETSPEDISRRLLLAAERIRAAKPELGPLLALESGKALETECWAEVDLMAAIFTYFAGASREIKGRSQKIGARLMTFTSHHPYGVVASIVPWNVPLMLFAYKVVAPIVAGNAVVVKLPDEVSLTLLHVWRLIEDLFPAGVITPLTGPGAVTGAALTAHPGIDKISFTGSVPTGQAIAAVAAPRLLPVTLELGGKSPMIVLDDCDMTRVTDGMMNSMRFTRAGQSCTAASRIYVPRAQLEDYVARLGTLLEAMTIGDALDSATACGPVVTARQQARIEGFLTRARDAGCDVRAYGKKPSGNGYFVLPHLVVAPDHMAEISQEEVFGPVATITPYDDLKQAIGWANGTRFGLSGSVWGRNINQCLYVADQVRAGILQINQNAVMLPGMSYGGVGESGLGKESSREAMIESYMFEKTNIVNFDHDV